MDQLMDSIRYGMQRLLYYGVQPFVTMANHASLLVLPRVSPWSSAAGKPR